MGDGEFDGIRWLADIQQRGWYYVCRTAPTTLMEAFGYRFPIDQVATSPQEGWYCREAYITRTRYGPVMVIGYWPWRRSKKRPVPGDKPGFARGSLALVQAAGID